MEAIVHGTAARVARGLGLVIGAWLVLSPAMSGADTAALAGAAAIGGGPERLYLAQAGTTPAASPVSYATEQANRGEDRFERDCVECHGDDLRGGLNGGAPLRGSVFEQKFFEGLPASVLFSYMSSAMPPQSPGRYSAHTYADLMAYVLKRNGIQPGAPLPTELDALNQMIIEK